MSNKTHSQPTDDQSTTHTSEPAAPHCVNGCGVEAVADGLCSDCHDALTPSSDPQSELDALHDQLRSLDTDELSPSVRQHTDTARDALSHAIDELDTSND